MTYIFSNGTLSDALEVNDNFNKLNKLTNEKAINDVSATNSGVLAGSSQVLIDKFLDSNGQNNTVDTGSTTADYTNYYVCDRSMSGTTETIVDNGDIFDRTTYSGIKITTTSACYITYLKFYDTNNDATKWYITDSSLNILSSGEIYNTMAYPYYSLSNSTTYYILCNSSGSTFKTCRKSLSFPIAKTHFSLIKGYDQSADDNSRAGAVQSVETTTTLSFNDSFVQSAVVTIPTGMTKVFVTPLMYEALSGSDNITADVSIDNGAHYTTGVPINTWTPITSANGTQLIVKANLLTGSGVSTPKISGWRVLME